MLAKAEPLRIKGDRSGSKSGYTNVYFSKVNNDGASVFIAKVKRGGKLITLPGSRSTRPYESACHAVHWYEEHFGANWPAAQRARKQPPYLIRQSAKYRGYVAAVWVQGNREEVVVLKQGRVTGRLAVFASSQKAREGVKAYLRQRYGLFADTVAWRTKNDKGQAFAHPSRAA